MNLYLAVRLTSLIFPSSATLSGLPIKSQESRSQNVYECIIWFSHQWSRVHHWFYSSDNSQEFLICKNLFSNNFLDVWFENFDVCFPESAIMWSLRCIEMPSYSVSEESMRFTSPRNKPPKVWQLSLTSLNHSLWCSQIFFLPGEVIK